VFHSQRIAAAFMLASFLCCAGIVGVSIDALAPQQAQAQEIDDSYFYTSLAPYGQWVQSVELGWVWHPAQVSAGWRPYTDGRWVWTEDAGWVWVSYEPFGWATYHYGRWYVDPYYGWSWVPGRVWAPAWVSWRVESGYIGWAPLWPSYFHHHRDWDWDYYRHDDEWRHRHHDADYDPWIFTRDRDFASPRVGRFLITDTAQRQRIFSHSRDITQFDENHPERIGRSLDRRIVERAVGQPIRPVRLETADRPQRHDETARDDVRIFRPRVIGRPDVTPDRLGVAKQTPKEERDREVQAWNKIQRRGGNAARPENAAQRNNGAVQRNEGSLPQPGGVDAQRNERGAVRNERRDNGAMQRNEVGTQRNEGAVGRKEVGTRRDVNRRGEGAATPVRREGSQLRGTPERPSARPATKERTVPTGRQLNPRQPVEQQQHRNPHAPSYGAPASRGGAAVEPRPHSDGAPARRNPTTLEPQRQPTREMRYPHSAPSRQPRAMPQAPRPSRVSSPPHAPRTGSQPNREVTPPVQRGTAPSGRQQGPDQKTHP